MGVNEIEKKIRDSESDKFILGLDEIEKARLKNSDVRKPHQERYAQIFEGITETSQPGITITPRSVRREFSSDFRHELGGGGYDSRRYEPFSGGGYDPYGYGRDPYGYGQDRSGSRQSDKTKEYNPYGMVFEELSEEEVLRQMIEADIPVFLHGETGCGKSSRVKEIDPDCEIIYLRQATPENLNGRSINSNGEMVDIPPTWYVKLCKKCEEEPNKIHILFFDEISNALPSIQGMAFNIILDREVNGKWKLPNNVRIVAAGNEMEESLSANQIAAPLFSRFAHIYIKNDWEKWLLWASKHDIHPAVYAFIAYHKGEILRTEYNGKTPNADPRKWEMVSKLLKSTKNPTAIRALIGEELASEFIAFCKLKVITLQQVLEDSYSESDLLMDSSQQYATIIGLSAVSEKDFMKVRAFVLQMNPELCRVFEGMWARGDNNRLDIVTEARMGNEKNVRRAC